MIAIIGSVGVALAGLYLLLSPNLALRARTRRAGQSPGPERRQ